VISLATAGAEELSVERTDVVAIRPSREAQEIRVLMRFTLPEAVVAGGSVDFACVQFDVSCRGRMRLFRLRLFG
jgi:hypothetical protein